jgi:hypothetical protein
MQTTIAKILTAATLSLASFAATATPLLVNGGGAVAGGSDCTFACVSHYQQAYDDKVFGSTPVTITSISFFVADYTAAWATGNLWQLSMSTAANAVNSLSSTFSANLGKDNKIFSTTSFSGTPSTGSAITFNGAFTYDPSKGDLLIDIVALGATDGPGLQYTYNANGVFSRVYAFSNVAKGSAGSNYGNVTSFNVAAAQVPEPASLMLMGLGLVGVAAARRKAKQA